MGFKGRTQSITRINNEIKGMTQGFIKRIAKGMNKGSTKGRIGIKGFQGGFKAITKGINGMREGMKRII